MKIITSVELIECLDRIIKDSDIDAKNYHRDSLGCATEQSPFLIICAAKRSFAESLIAELNVRDL